MKRDSLWLFLLYVLSAFALQTAMQLALRQAALHMPGLAGNQYMALCFSMLAAGLLFFVFYRKQCLQNRSFFYFIPLFYSLAVMFGFVMCLTTQKLLFVFSLCLYFLMGGFQLGVCQYSLYQRYRSGLSVGVFIALAAICAQSLLFFLDWLTPHLPDSLHAVSLGVLTAAATAGMGLILVFPLKLSRFLEADSLYFAVSEPKKKQALRLEPLFIACTIILMSLMGGVYDASLFEVTHAGSGNPFFSNQLFFVPGILAGGFLADVRRGQYLPLACTLASTLFFPELLRFSSGLFYIQNSTFSLIAGGIFYIYIMVALLQVAPRCPRPFFWVMLPGFLYHTCYALGALLTPALRSLPIERLSVLYVLTLGTVIVAFTLTGRLRIREQEALPASPTGTSQEARRSQLQFSRHIGLTQRENEVLSLLVKGHCTEDIAKTLFLSQSTVKHHIGKILAKADCKNRVELLVRYNHETLDQKVTPTPKA